tara:strand:- start:7732 stop:8196 length:465 start_codon:yes stop_codon:yes gene_type:complete
MLALSSEFQSLTDAADRAQVRARFLRRPVASFLAAAAQIYGVPVAVMLSENRKAAVVRARGWAIYHAIAEQRTSKSDVARRCGYVDHSSAIHAANAHAARHRLPLVTDSRQCLWLAYEGPEPSLEQPWDAAIAKAARHAFYAARGGYRAAGAAR